MAGVCGGFAEYLNIDPVLVRIAWVALTFLGGSGLLIYIAALIIIPENTSQNVESEPSFTTRKYQYAKQIYSYLLAEQYPYIHLFDGGLSDNLGIRTIVDITFKAIIKCLQVYAQE
ncbi:MAG: PspC domain-containing protein [Calditrichaceae bacterium]